MSARWGLLQCAVIASSHHCRLHLPIHSQPSCAAVCTCPLICCSGPGCSSVGTAFIGEHGPFFPRPGSTSKLMENPYRRALRKGCRCLDLYLVQWVAV